MKLSIFIFTPFAALCLFSSPLSIFSLSPSSFSENQSLAKLLCTNNQNTDSLQHQNQPRSEKNQEEKIENSPRDDDFLPKFKPDRKDLLEEFIKKLKGINIVIRTQNKEPARAGSFFCFS